jgi:MATE family multidrug resistance protein
MSDHVDIQQSARSYFFWLYLLPIVSVGCYMLDGIFIGASQTRLMLITMIISVVAIFFPCWWLFRDFDNHGLWAAFTLFNFSRTGLMAMAYYSLSRKKRWINRWDVAA